jgi:hypothetical protein
MKQQNSHMLPWKRTWFLLPEIWFFWPSKMVLFSMSSLSPRCVCVGVCACVCVRVCVTHSEMLSASIWNQNQKTLFIHLPFFCLLSFLQTYILPVSRTAKSTSISASQTVVMETSQVSVLPAVVPAVHCGTCGLVLKVYPSRSNIVRPLTNNPSTSAVYCILHTVYCKLYTVQCIVSVFSCWETIACHPAQKTSKSPGYCSSPIVCMY